MKYPDLKHLFYYIKIFIFVIIMIISIICIIYITIIKKEVNKINIEIDNLDYITNNNNKQFNDYIAKNDISIQTFNTHLQNNDISIQTINTHLQNTDNTITKMDTKINSYIDKINIPVTNIIPTNINPIIPANSSTSKDNSIVELHNKLLTYITSNDSKLNEYITSNNLKLTEYITTNDETNKIVMDHLNIINNKLDSMKLTK